MSPVPVVLAVTVQPSVPNGTLDVHLQVVVSHHRVVRKVLPPSPAKNGGTSSGTGSGGTTTHHASKSAVKPSSEVNLNQLGQTNTNANITNSLGGHINSKSDIRNNANVNSTYRIFCLVINPKGTIRRHYI
jgi:hypothetical protein